MKRDLRLRGLSEKHHHALALAHRLATNDPGADDPRRLGMQFDVVIEPHFLLEEEVLFVELRRLGEGSLVDRAMADHEFLRKQVSIARTGDPIAIRVFAERLADHVRFEERELLPRCETLFAKEALDEIARRTPREVSIREGFRADHRRLEQLVSQLHAAFESSDRAGVTRLWASLVSGLLRHLDAEETHLVPELLRKSERDARVIIGEHRHLRARLTELGLELDSAHVAMARDFIEELRAHERNEDRLLYPWADEHLDATEQKAMLDALTHDEHGALEQR